MDHLLDTTELLDCTGRVTHRLTLLLDGTVRVQMGDVTVLVEPSGRGTRPTGGRLGRGEHSHDQVLAVARSMAERR